jgi:hypothetical protein
MRAKRGDIFREWVWEYADGILWVELFARICGAQDRVPAGGGECGQFRLAAGRDVDILLK